MDETLKQSLDLNIRLNRIDWLVNLAENAIKINHPIQEKSQLESLLGVANETRSSRVVINWVQYQMGRSGKPQEFWRDSNLGKQVQSDIEGEIKKTAYSIADQVYGTPASEEQRSDVHIRLIRLYAGYLKRWLVAMPRQEQPRYQGNRR